MHMSIARSAIGRGMQLVAGMLNTVATMDSKAKRHTEATFQLVTWQTTTHSRREDELARIRSLENA